MLSSTPVRKSFIKRKEDQVTFTPIESTTDDERRKRRSVYNVEQNLENYGESDSIVSENFDQIKTHLTMCQKLFNENKINIHTAWNVKVINYMGHYISKNKIDSEVMLIGAKTLEVCVKVYGCKVDYLSQEVVKLASNMASAKNKNRDADAEDEIPEAEINENNPKPKKRKRILRATVVKDRTDLRVGEIPKLTPVDFIGNISVDVSSFENMAINKIPMDHTLYKFNIMNNVDRGFLSYDMEDPINSEELKSITFPKVKPFIICSAFKNFRVDEEDRDYNDSIASAMSNSLLNVHNTIGNEIAYDEDGIPIPELDGSMHDIFADNANDLASIVDEVNGPNGQTNQKRIEMITSFCPMVQSIQRENVSTSNSFLETIWVGPSHWKNKLLRPSAPRFSGKADSKVSQMKERRTESRREQRILSINFDDADEEIDLRQKCKTKQASHNIAKCTLPQNGLNVLPEFDKLILINIIPTHEYTQNHVESEFEHSPYDYNNADDSQYCSQVDLQDPGDEPQENREANNILEAINEGDILNGDDAGNTVNETGENVPSSLNTSIDLIDAPDVVTQTYCPYALRAKNVNMKKLKTAMLDCLVKDKNESISNSIVEKQLKIQPTLFSEVFKELPSKLPSKQRSGLTVPLAFFSLLHLTNEYNLELTKFESLNDLKIEKL